MEEGLLERMERLARECHVLKAEAQQAGTVRAAAEKVEKACDERYSEKHGEYARAQRAWFESLGK